MIDSNYIKDLKVRAGEQIVDIADQLITGLKKTGKTYSACCPFHDEKTPSFHVNPDRGDYHCFGCGAGGSAFGLVMELERLDFPSAVERVSKLTGFGPVKYADDENRQPQDTRIPKIKSALNSAASLYMTSLVGNPDAIMYLKSRSITGNDVQDFMIGYAPSGYSTIKNALLRQYGEQILLEGSLLSKNDKEQTYDFFNDRIMFPVRNETGDVVAFGGRRFDGIKDKKYLNSRANIVFDKSDVLFGLYEALETPSSSVEKGVFNVVEGYMDVVAMHRHEFTNTVASMGTALTETQIKKLFRRCEKIRLMRDGDKAGIESTERSILEIAPLLTHEKMCSVVILPPKHDPDSFLAEHGRNGMIAAIGREISCFDFLLNFYQHINGTTVEGNAKTTKKLNEFLNQLRDGSLVASFRSLWMRKSGFSMAYTKARTHAQLEESLKKLPAQIQNSLSGISDDVKKLAGIYLKEPNFQKLLRPSEVWNAFSSKADINLIEFSLAQNSRDTEAKRLLAEYLISVAPNDTANQIEIIKQFQDKVSLALSDSNSSQPSVSLS